MSKDKKNVKKRIIILSSICLIVLIGALIINSILNRSYFNELKYDELMKKIDDKDSFVLCISQTTCSHCAEYKPRLERVANDKRVDVYYIEADLLSEEEHKKLSSLFSFSGTPTTVFVINGREKTAATRINGAASREKIIKKLIVNGFLDEE